MSGHQEERAQPARGEPAPLGRQAEMNPGDKAPPGAEFTGENLCRECGGSGRLQGGAPCPTCGGSGKVIEPVSMGP